MGGLFFIVSGKLFLVWTARAHTVPGSDNKAGCLEVPSLDSLSSLSRKGNAGERSDLP